MRYDLMCDKCGVVDEHEIPMDGEDDIVECPNCKADLSRRENRVYDVPMIQGDTVSGGCSYSYWDDNLGVQVKNKQHRKDEMAKQGLTEYSPDPELKALRDEARYIAKNSNDTDGQANSAIKKTQADAATKRREKIVDKTFKDANLGGLTND